MNIDNEQFAMAENRISDHLKQNDWEQRCNP